MKKTRLNSHLYFGDSVPKKSKKYLAFLCDRLGFAGWSIWLYADGDLDNWGENRIVSHENLSTIRIRADLLDTQHGNDIIFHEMMHNVLSPLDRAINEVELLLGSKKTRKVARKIIMDAIEESTVRLCGFKDMVDGERQR